nr:MAG TPA: hypothetical protein [Caudoviricetes sp.]
MSSLKSRLSARTQSAQTTTEREQSELFINLGIEIEIEGKPTFVNLPLTLTADRLAEVIEKQVKSISANSPNSWVELVEGRIALGEAVQQLFNALDKGESVRADEIDPANEEFGFLSNLQIQFTKRSERAEVETGDAKRSVLDKFRK